MKKLIAIATLLAATSVSAGSFFDGSNEGRGYGNGSANGDATFSMSFSGNARGNVDGNGYSYNEQGYYWNNRNGYGSNPFYGNGRGNGDAEGSFGFSMSFSGRADADSDIETISSGLGNYYPDYGYYSYPYAR